MSAFNFLWTPVLRLLGPNIGRNVGEEMDAAQFTNAWRKRLEVQLDHFRQYRADTLAVCSEEMISGHGLYIAADQAPLRCALIKLLIALTRRVEEYEGFASEHLMEDIDKRQLDEGWDAAPYINRLVPDWSFVSTAELIQHLERNQGRAKLTGEQTFILGKAVAQQANDMVLAFRPIHKAIHNHFEKSTDPLVECRSLEEPGSWTLVHKRDVALEGALATLDDVEKYNHIVLERLRQLALNEASISPLDAAGAVEASAMIDSLITESNHNWGRLSCWPRPQSW